MADPKPKAESKFAGIFQNGGGQSQIVSCRDFYVRRRAFDDRDFQPHSFDQLSVVGDLLAQTVAQFGALRVGFDHHQRIKTQLPENCRQIDKPIAGLLTDLRQRGLLKDTLVIWGGEFGRSPDAPNGDGRDHNHKGYTTWMAGGGVKGGLSYGATDEHGYQAVEDKCHVHDWHATILHLLGLDHERLTYRYAGRNFRLTDVAGNVIDKIIA